MMRDEIVAPVAASMSDPTLIASLGPLSIGEVNNKNRAKTQAKIPLGFTGNCA